MGWNVGIRVGEKEGIIISMCNVGLARGELQNKEDTSSDTTISYYVDGQ